MLIAKKMKVATKMMKTVLFCFTVGYAVLTNGDNRNSCNFI